MRLSLPEIKRKISKLIPDDIDSDVTWTSENTYFLNNQAFVKSGATLTIEAGTVIVGRYDANYSADNPAHCSLL